MHFVLLKVTEKAFSFPFHFVSIYRKKHFLFPFTLCKFTEKKCLFHFNSSCDICGSEYRFFIVTSTVGDPIIKGWDLINWFHPTTFLNPSQTRTWNSIGIIWWFFFLFLTLRWEVVFRFVDIGEIIWPPLYGQSNWNQIFVFVVRVINRCLTVSCIGSSLQLTNQQQAFQILRFYNQAYESHRSIYQYIFNFYDWTDMYRQIKIIPTNNFNWIVVHVLKTSY